MEFKSTLEFTGGCYQGGLEFPEGLDPIEEMSKIGQRQDGGDSGKGYLNAFAFKGEGYITMRVYDRFGSWRVGSDYDDHSPDFVEWLENKLGYELNFSF